MQSLDLASRDNVIWYSTNHPEGDLVTATGKPGSGWCCGLRERPTSWGQVQGVCARRLAGSVLRARGHPGGLQGKVAC